MRAIRLGFAVLAVLGLTLLFGVGLHAERSDMPFPAQKIFYRINVTPTGIEFVLFSSSDLPKIRAEVLEDREGFVLHLSRRAKLEMENLSNSKALVVLPINETRGTAVLVLTPGTPRLVQTEFLSNRAGFEITSNSGEMVEFLARHSGMAGSGAGKGPDQTSSPTGVGTQLASANSALESSGEVVLLRGRVVKTPLAAQTLALPKVKPNGSIQSYMNAAIDPPGSDTVYLPGTTLGGAENNVLLGYKIGPGTLRPYVSFIYEYDSNFLGTNTNALGVSSYTLSPILEYEIPGETRDFRIAYNPVFRWIAGFSQPSHIEHYLNFDSSVEATDWLRFSVRDHFVRGIFDSRQFDPGRELSFSSEPYLRNDIGGEVNVDVTEKDRLIGDADFNRLVFDNRNNSTFFNYDTYSLSAGWLRDQWLTANFFARYTYTKDITSGTNAAGRSGNTNSYEFGINKTFTDRTSGNFTIGYRTTSYNNQGLSNFHGWTARASLTKELNDRNVFDVAFLRSTSLSNFGINSYFVNDGVNARFQHSGERYQLTFRGGFQRNQYPQDSILASTLGGVPVVTLGPRRNDHLWDAGVDLGIILNSQMIVDFGYDFQDRISNLGDGFNFRRHIFHVSFNMGHASSGEGSQVYTRQPTAPATPQP
ncbi:MAG: hypothetical protein PHX83_13630 [Acidobacteriia bacterium]|nr:hypothetical protein [Terriglobia bacterium]